MIVENKRFITIIENLGYLVLIGLIIGQCVTKRSFLLGQYFYLTSNCLMVLRSFILHRPTSDKIKDCSCLAITLGLILIT